MTDAEKLGDTANAVSELAIIAARDDRHSLAKLAFSMRPTVREDLTKALVQAEQTRGYLVEMSDAAPIVVAEFFDELRAKGWHPAIALVEGGGPDIDIRVRAPMERERVISAVSAFVDELATMSDEGFAALFREARDLTYSFEADGDDIPF